MAKKAKPQPEAKPVEAPAEDKKKPIKKGKPQKAEEQNFEVFSEQFNQTLDNFKVFYSEVLQLKAETQGTDLSNEFDQVRERVSKKLETASTDILKEELVDLENWISDQQTNLSTEIKKVEEALNSNEKSLNSTGAFTQKEVRDQLAVIQGKIDEKTKTHSQYGDLLKRSKEVYQ